MKIIDNNLNIEETSYDYAIPANSNYVFFDIETTGLARRSSIIYLAGFLYRAPEGLRSHQLLIESLEEEKELIQKTLEFLNGFDHVITFNGDTFDIPMLKERLKFHGIHSVFNFTQFDIYKKIRPYKKILGLESMKQKSIESFLHIDREDKMSGGELINVFFFFLKIHDEESFNLLIQHNFDDICGMPALLKILKYTEIFNLTPSVISSSITDSSLELDIRLPYNLPVPVNFSHDEITISIADASLHLDIKAVTDTLYHYFANYKDYYYLPAEDTAIHRSVAEFVDSSAKVKAKASNCYVKKYGTFLPEYTEKIFSPEFRFELHDRNMYFEMKDEIFANLENASIYAKAILNHIRPN